MPKELKTVMNDFLAGYFQKHKMNKEKEKAYLIVTESFVSYLEKECRIKNTNEIRLYHLFDFYLYCFGNIRLAWLFLLYRFSNYSRRSF